MSTCYGLTMFEVGSLRVSGAGLFKYKNGDKKEQLLLVDEMIHQLLIVKEDIKLGKK